MTTTQERAVEHRPRWTCRAAATFTVVTAALVSVQLGSGRPDAYVLALVGTVVLGLLVVAGRLWQRRTFESALGVAGMAVLTLAGQTLVATVGPPGSTDAHWSALAVAVVGCALVVLALVAADAPTSARDAEDHRPYAL